MSVPINPHDHGPGDEAEAKWCPSCGEPTVVAWEEYNLEGHLTACVQACMRCGWGQEDIING